MPAPARGTRGVVFAQLVGLAVAVAISGAILGTVVLGLLFGTMNNVG